MKNRFAKLVGFSFLIVLSVFGCQKSQIRTDKTENYAQPTKAISASEISKLKNGETAQFSAVLKRRETNCIEIFSEDEFKQHNGDFKFAVSSRFTEESVSTSFEDGKKVIVRGTMSFVKEVSDTSKTCGVVTGQLFEISEIQEF